MSDHKIVLIGCAHSAGVAIEDLLARGGALPDNVEWVSMSCAGAIDELHILRSYEAGADQVMIIACCEGACRSGDGNRWAAKRVKAAKALLEEAGIARWRTAFHNLAPTMAADLLPLLGAFHEPEPQPDEKE